MSSMLTALTSLPPNLPIAPKDADPLKIADQQLDAAVSGGATGTALNSAINADINAYEGVHRGSTLGDARAHIDQMLDPNLRNKPAVDNALTAEEKSFGLNDGSKIEQFQTEAALSALATAFLSNNPKPSNTGSGGQGSGV